MKVSETKLFAERVVIPVVATDVVGCAHQCAEGMFDISDDLMYRGRSPSAASWA